MAKIHSALVRALRDYWQKKQACEQARKVFSYPGNARTRDIMDPAIAAVRSFSEQEAKLFSFRYWYLIHLVFPEDIAVYRKMLSRAEAPHEKLYALVVGIVYADPHFGHQKWNRKDLNEFQDAILMPWIESFRKETDPMMDAREYDRVSRLVRNSTMNRGIEHCAFAWLFGSVDGKELHRYPMR